MTTSRGARVRGVIADDDDFIRSVVCAALVERGITMIQAESGAAAIEVAPSVDFAVIDARMPGLPLAETIAGLRADRCMPVLVISGAPAGSLPSQVDYLAKPFELSALLASVDALVDSLPDRDGS